jgi:hypothetical protein
MHHAKYQFKLVPKYLLQSKSDPGLAL